MVNFSPEALKSFELVMTFLFCHLIGDYFLQSDWMALNKSKKTFNCLVHVILYTACFLFLTFSWKALLFIGVTHFILDRFPIIIRMLIHWKNHINPQFYYPMWEFCNSTGYYDDCPNNEMKPVESYWKRTLGTPRPFHLTLFLYIVTDNTLHLICNYIALRYFS